MRCDVGNRSCYFAGYFKKVIAVELSDVVKTSELGFVAAASGGVRHYLPG